MGEYDDNRDGVSGMIYSEAAYFEENHCQHCADRDEFLRLRNIRARVESLMPARYGKLMLRDFDYLEIVKG